MRTAEGKRYLFAFLIMMMLLLTAAPATTFGQGRRDRDWNNNYWRHNKKCQKFVNCHDARDGRVDGRGPRGERVGNVVWLNNRNRRSWWTTRQNNQNRWQRRMWYNRHR